MLIDGWAIVFNLLSIAILGLLAATLFLSVVWLLLSKFIFELSARARKIALSLVVTMPWSTSFFCVLVFTPSLIQLKQLTWLGHIAHWHHPYIFNFASWHGMSLLISVLALLCVLVRRLSITLSHLNSLNTLIGLSYKKIGSLQAQPDVVVLESQNPLAFTAGLWKPKCYITTGLIGRMTEDELNIIIDHERIHIRHSDTGYKLAFSVFATIYPKPLARSFRQHFSLAVEQVADAYVSRIYNRFDIAKTLVKAARIQLKSTRDSVSPLQAFFACDDIENRVRELIDPSAKRSFPSIFCILILVVTPLISSYGVDGIHHLVESIFSH